MLQVKNLKKEYVTGDLEQVALNDVSINFRKNEFVAILGPSGSGKTTLLNIIGGLDKYDSGDIIINNISTKKYTDKDWDSYRNHSIGFIFQNYNLIGHQSLLSNVELALTLSGVNKKERKKIALESLKKVGLEEQAHKKPNQLSGGQMQRVAIARALVNNPDIILADEPTGALDTETSVQIMELLKEVSKDRLVIMVTHNSELAEKYSNRIVKIKDGKIIDDTNPYNENNNENEIIEHKNLGKSSMKFFTSLSLSFNNLKTKKGRTLLISFAGSIGIIGIALILAFSNGVNKYIEDIQKEVMTAYPISIQKQTVDFTSIMTENKNVANAKGEKYETNGIYSNNSSMQMASNMMTSISKNNLTKFREYLEQENNPILQYVGENGIIYSYDTDFDLYSYDKDNQLICSENVNIKPDENTFTGSMTSGLQQLNEMTGQSQSIFTEILPSENGLISNVVKENYNLAYGKWPEKENELVLIANTNNEVPVLTLYKLGLLPVTGYNEFLNKLDKNEKIDSETIKLEYKDIVNHNMYLMTETDKYIENENNLYDYIGLDEDKLSNIIKNAYKVNIVGIIKPNENAEFTLSGTVGYTKKLTDYIINHINNSEIVTKQKENKNINVINGFSFKPKNDDEKITDVKAYMNGMTNSEKVEYGREIILQMCGGDKEKANAQIANMTENDLINMMNKSISELTNEQILQLYDKYISTGSYEENIKDFHVVDVSTPSGIDIYVDSFEAKENVSNCINEYNEKANDEDKIVYVDYIGLMLSSILTIVDVISIVLIAFVSVSLIVSSIMIGIITYISVLERTKEIGVLRAIGASKRNISQVFNAETLIIGFFSGTLGILITLLILLPGNIILRKVTEIETISAFIDPKSAILLILLSIILTFIGGLIPAKKAAKKDPVLALRSE